MFLRLKTSNTSPEVAQKMAAEMGEGQEMTLNNGVWIRAYEDEIDISVPGASPNQFGYYDRSLDQAQQSVGNALVALKERFPDLVLDQLEQIPNTIHPRYRTRDGSVASTANFGQADRTEADLFQRARKEALALIGRA